jgi:nucleoid DNA-binding protein
VIEEITQTVLDGKVVKLPGFGTFGDRIETPFLSGLSMPLS